MWTADWLHKVFASHVFLVKVILSLDENPGVLPLKWKLLAELSCVPIAIWHFTNATN